MDEKAKTEWTNYMQRYASMYWAKYDLIFPNLGPCPTIRLNMRFTSTAGTNKYWENVVELAAKLIFRSKPFAMEIRDTILPHELAHQIDYNLNGIPEGNKWHGNDWKIIMLKIGQDPVRCHKMDYKTGIISE